MHLMPKSESNPEQTLESPVGASFSLSCALPSRSWWRLLFAAGLIAERESAQLLRPCEIESVAAILWQQNMER